MLGAALLFGRLYQASPPSPAQSDFTGRCVGVTDGDTIRVLHAGREERVRLFGIDCPERGQAYHSATREFTSELALGRTLRVQWRGRDRYGRVLGWVELPDGRILNVEIVRAGMGWWYRRYAPDSRELASAEREARSARRGLWKDRSPTPPWEFKRRTGAAPTPTE